MRLVHSIARILPVDNLYYHFSFGQLSTTCSNASEVAEWVAPSCSGPQPATDNGERDC